MIKNIYDKNYCKYYHEYYCDKCFLEINNCGIFRHKKAIEDNKFDLCDKCWEEYYKGDK